MRLILSIRGAGVFGANPTYSLAGQYLADGLGDYGTAVRDLGITACFRGGPVGHPSLQSLFDRYHAEFLPSLPTTKFLRKKARLELEYETSVADATFLRSHGPPSAAVFARVLSELAETLHLLDRKLKKSDDVALSRFHEDVARLVREAPQTDDALRLLQARIRSDEQARRGAMDPWDLLDIDWDEYHPSARRLLGDPFFWDEADDYAPHGNDTGADVLADFILWNRRHPSVPAWRMAQELLRAWGISAFDHATVDRAAVAALLQRDPSALSVTDEAMIAAAFAAMKLRGSCDAETRALALSAIERQRIAEAIADGGPHDAAEHLRRLDLLAATLRKSGEAPLTPAPSA